MKINTQAIRQAITPTWVAHDTTAVDMKAVSDFGQLDDVISFYDSDGHVICTFKFESQDECNRQFNILLHHLDAFILK